MAAEKRELKRLFCGGESEPGRKPSGLERAEKMLVNSARQGSRAATELIAEIMASDMRGIAGERGCTAEEVSGLFFLVAPEKAIAAHLREIRGEKGVKASEAQVLDAISDLRKSKVREMRAELGEIAEKSPYESVREAARMRLQGE